MIHTIRTVAVGDQESKIDSPIILYRGDREIEVEFTINGSKFTFTNGGNVIKSTNATHGQLVINTPTGENMFSEVTECHDGKVVFIITKEMTDELIEVGFYSFQIRLFDESQVSRVTIPPVLKGIDIRNPIAAEDETNVVDIGLVDYAVVVKDEFEDLSTFLPDGNYNKTEWESKDVISGAKLNKIEDALYNINSNMEATDLALSNKVENINKNVYREIDKLGNELESEVEELERNLNKSIGEFKIDVDNSLDAVNENISDVNDKLGDKMDRNAILTMANMGQDVKEAMTGGSVAVVGNHAVGAQNLLPNQVTHDKLANNVLKFKDSNLVTEVFNNGFVNWNNGVIQSSDVYSYSNYISVKGYGKLYGRCNYHYAFYDSGLKFIQGHQGYPNAVEPIEIDVPENAEFIRISIQTKIVHEFVLGVSLDFVSYQGVINTLVIPSVTPNGEKIILDDGMVTTNALADKSVGAEKTSDDIMKCSRTPNRFIVEYENMFVNWNGTNLASSEEYDTSAYIPIKEGDIIYQTTNAHYAIYDAIYKRIDGHRDTEYSNPITAPSGSAYIRVSPKRTFKDTYMITINEEPSEYIEAGYIMSKRDDMTIMLPREKMVDTVHLHDRCITKDKLDYGIATCTPTPNRFIVEYENMFVNWDRDNLASSELYVTSVYIPIKEGDIIYQTTNAHYAIYDAIYKRIDGHRDTEYSNPITAPSGSAYIRVSPKRTFKDTYMITINEEPSEYIEAGWVLDDIAGAPILLASSNSNNVDKIANSRLYGKKVSWYGTSITQGYGWCQLVNSTFHFSATNNGVGGTAICEESEYSSMCTKNRMLGQYSSVTDPNTGEVTLSGTPIPSDVEIIFVEGGTNDWARCWPIGDKEFSENPDNQTFAGACHLMFKNMTELFPNAEIIIVGSPFGKLADRDRFTNKYGILNNENLQSIEYGDVLLEIAGKWGIKGFNMGRVMQIHDNNVATLIPDGLHLNTDEAKQRAADSIIAYLLTL